MLFNLGVVAEAVDVLSHLEICGAGYNNLFAKLAINVCFLCVYQTHNHLARILLRKNNIAFIKIATSWSSTCRQDNE